MSKTDWASIIYSYFFIVGGVAAVFGYVAKHVIKSHTEDIRDDLSKIMYALYNDGKTGLINKVEELLEHQQSIKIDVEVMKSKIE